MLLQTVGECRNAGDRAGHEVVTARCAGLAAIVIGGAGAPAVNLTRCTPAAWSAEKSSEGQMGSLRALLVIPLVGFAIGAARAEEPAVVIPAPTLDATAPDGAGAQKVILAGGCFWGVQAVFQHTKGVTSAVSGYAGGDKTTAQYETVSGGRTGHAESVSVTFDPRQISYGKILQIYFSVAHNPTELNRQGPDTGTQYRSEIFYTNDDQKRVASAYIAQLDKAHVFPRPIVTQLEPLRGFYPAEDYHQDFAVLHPSYPYIVFNDLPKVDNLKRLFAGVYRDTPVTVMASSKPSE
jgi:peptide-methionine (S)-S-oxide reductase